MRTSNPASDSFLQIEHDIHSQVVYNLTDYILNSLLTNGYQSVTVGECLGDPVSNWYRSGPAGSVTTPLPGTSTSTRNTRTSISAVPTGAPGTVTKDGTCGNGVTCRGSRYGTCCSKYNYCGVGDDYCKVANGCQASFGTCDDAPGTVSITRTGRIPLFFFVLAKVGMQTNTTQSDQRRQQPES